MAYAMPSSTTELIKSKLDIVEFLRGYLTLTPAGRNFKALCPFHREKTPSFMISPDRQSWHCFGCNTGGDIFGFAMRYENLEFGEALRMLAEKAGVELRRENQAEYRYAGVLYDLNEAAKKYFRKALAAAPVAREYLAARGLAQETAETFELGWAPDEPEALSMHLLNGGASPQDLVQAGLSIKTERGLMLDRFRGRIMFPIHNHIGKVVGFTGRILPQVEQRLAARRAGAPGREAPSGAEVAKYANSPETPIFRKSQLLYGFWKSKDAIREAKTAFLVEGQMDFLMSWQSGMKNAVASSGTALTADHLRALRRVADTLVISFDGDAAGMDAAERAIDLSEAEDFEVKVAVIEGYKDAADAAQADPANVRRAYDAAMPAPAFYFGKYLPKEADIRAGGSAAFRTREGLRALRAVLGKLSHIASPVLRESWFAELSARTGIPGRTLAEEAAKAASAPAAGNAPRDDAAEAKRAAPRAGLIAEELFAAALAADDLPLLDDCAEYFDAADKEIFRMLKSGARRSEDPGLDERIGIITLRAADRLAPEEISALKRELAKEYYKERRAALARTVRDAEARGNEAELAAALKALGELPSALPNDEK